ncbi:hypothetical protein EYM_06520 [Ignicoccus islandicus DSM 13165]|uniref:AAA domain-containing protein n=1 Tax=Ignicoccus islandicus DSM 13165 TaxID=940295 RepID=A0A0U3F542_9CREN|nr:hypothetical protein [Ignicoccus islandicus]ALU12693.1 hypothetical protein EYM_06520 [Ignicoccus islandicus DSM 13165]
MKLMVQLSPCGGSGRHLIAYETAVHLAMRRGGGKYLIMDISSNAVSPLDIRGCYLGYLMGRYHPSEAIVKIPRHDNFYYTRFITPTCIKDLNYNLGLVNSRLEEIISKMAIEIKDLIKRNYTVIITASYDILTMNLIEELMRGPLSFIMDSEPVLISNENIVCIKESIRLMEELNLRSKNLIVNKVPAAEIMRLRDEVISLNGLNLAVLIPLSRQLYFRHFAHYMSVAIKANTNPHARTISHLFDKILRILEGTEEGGKVLALIGGLINETDLIPSVNEGAKIKIF